MAVALRYFTEFGKHAFQHITAASICGGMHASIVFCSTCTMSSYRKFTFAISSPDEFLLSIYYRLLLLLFLYFVVRVRYLRNKKVSLGYLISWQLSFLLVVSCDSDMTWKTREWILLRTFSGVVQLCLIKIDIIILRFLLFGFFRNHVNWYSIATLNV